MTIDERRLVKSAPALDCLFIRQSSFVIRQSRSAD
jgi:hypothetical protein